MFLLEDYHYNLKYTRTQYSYTSKHMQILSSSYIAVLGLLSTTRET
jgi:hypothetical protein